jgi:hypothetical protein
MCQLVTEHTGDAGDICCGGSKHHVSATSQSPFKSIKGKDGFEGGGLLPALTHGRSRSEKGKNGFKTGRLLMARANQHVHCIPGFESAHLERSAHAAANPIAELEASATVFDNLVGVEKKREVTCCVKLREFLVSDDRFKDSPLLNQTIAPIREALCQQLKRRIL